MLSSLKRGKRAEPRGAGPSSESEVVGQQRDVLEPFPERRQRDRNHSEPVEQVPAKDAAFDRLLRIPVGRRNEADVHVGVGGFEPTRRTTRPG